MPPFHGGDQGFDTPTGYIMISGRSMVECLTCNEVVESSILFFRSYKCGIIDLLVCTSNSGGLE